MSADTESELRASRARIVTQTNAARRSIERSLHDGPQQHLVAMAVKLRLAEQALVSAPATVPGMLEELRREVQSTIQHLRDVAHGIYPSLLGDRGLGEALAAAAARASVDVTVSVTVEGDGARRYPEDLEAAVYFSCLDAIGACTGPVTVLVGGDDDQLTFDVWGNLREGPALVNIADRTDTMGGRLTVERDAEADGAHVHGALPLR